jgi:lipoprotein-anchoring transpeptidase ErfK/SrfK
MTVTQVYSIFENAVDSYELTIKKDGVLLDTISAEDVGLNTGNTLDTLVSVCDRQQHFDWAKYYIKDVQTETTLDNVYEYDADKFSSTFDNLRAVSYTPTKKSINAKLQYTDGNYRIVPEVYGDEISKEALKDVILECMQSLKPEINTEKSNCYIMPSVTEHTESIVAARDKLNKILNGNMTLKLISKEVPMQRDAVNSWISVDENFNVSANESTIGSYVSVLGNKYSSYGKDRAFKTTYGDTVTVSQGDYGRQVNVAKLKEKMIEAINTAENMTIDVPFSRGAMGSLENDLGTTYVEIDLTNQRLWMYVNGKQILFTDIVTGKDDGTHYTPQGTYKLKYKQKNAILRGDNYETPVAWWMPFNGDIGLHDATWQPTFGGDRYKLHGSHGCVNLPLAKAEEIFKNAVVGMPVICYYHAKADMPATTTTQTTQATQ